MLGFSTCTLYAHLRLHFRSDPTIFWKPRVPTEGTKKLQEKTAAEIEVRKHQVSQSMLLCDVCGTDWIYTKVKACVCVMCVEQIVCMSKGW